MLSSGDVLEHPVTREKIVVRKTARDTDGELFQVDFYLQPGAFVAAEHIHPFQEERFEVIAGTLRGRVGGKDLTSGPGETVVVPKGTPHVWWNSGDDELHVLVEVRPALRFERFFETFFGLAQDGKVDPKTGLPNPLQLAVMMRTFRQELVLARPPQLVQTVLFGVLTPLAKLLGYRGECPYPTARQAQAS
ncbi:MAG TPA: cupin domain-containing protein [Chloroflexaceae bacterium]|nr:cupin domain-containing protein [Chloroflexaceae bacterium]